MAQIIWTERSKLDYWDNIEYLEREWTEKEIIRFNKKKNEVLSSLLQENVVFKSTNYKNIFEVIVIKQITLFYEVKEENIILLRFWNNYQDPKKLNFNK